MKFVTCILRATGCTTIVLMCTIVYHRPVTDCIILHRKVIFIYRMVTSLVVPFHSIHQRRNLVDAKKLGLENVCRCLLLWNSHCDRNVYQKSFVGMRTRTRSLNFWLVTRRASKYYNFFDATGIFRLKQKH